MNERAQVGVRALAVSRRGFSPAQSGYGLDSMAGRSIVRTEIKATERDRTIQESSKPAH